MEPETNISEGYLGIEPDIPIYRIFPLWFFEAALQSKQLVLTNPTSWQDPYEFLAEGVMVTVKDITPWRQVPLHPYIKPVFAQCWSRTKESDTLLRAYSRVVLDPHVQRNTCPRDEGVRVRSTPRKILSALCTGVSEAAGQSCFVGSVKYGTADEIRGYFGEVISRQGINAFQAGQNRAQSMLLKRLNFRHEDEVRLLYVDQGHRFSGSLAGISIEPNEIFDEITYDPRLETFERLEREAVARKLGYQGDIAPFDLYRRHLLMVVIDHLPPGWQGPPYTRFEGPEWTNAPKE